jgi:hypothetical protein
MMNDDENDLHNNKKQIKKQTQRINNQPKNEKTVVLQPSSPFFVFF